MKPRRIRSLLCFVSKIEATSRRFPPCKTRRSKRTKTGGRVGFRSCTGVDRAKEGGLQLSLRPRTALTDATSPPRRMSSCFLKPPVGAAGYPNWARAHFSGGWHQTGELQDRRHSPRVCSSTTRGYKRALCVRHALALLEWPGHYK